MLQWGASCMAATRAGGGGAPGSSTQIPYREGPLGRRRRGVQQQRADVDHEGLGVQAAADAGLGVPDGPRTVP